MNRKIMVWLVGVVIFAVGGFWTYHGLGAYNVPVDPTVDAHQVYYGGAVMLAGFLVMLFSRRVAA